MENLRAEEEDPTQMKLNDVKATQKLSKNNSPMKKKSYLPPK
jgi:hypothetical protein